MKRGSILTFYIFVVLAIFTTSGYAATGGPHLWLSTDPNNFNEGGVGYTEGSNNTWEVDSYVSMSMPFTLYLYNSVQNPNKEDAVNIGLIVAVHGNETGTVTITDEFGNTTTLTSFSGTDIGPYYGGGNHGVYLPHDGVFAIYRPSTQIDLDSGPDGPGVKKWTSFVIESSSFSEVHFDAFSDNGFWNPASHDANYSIVPEPASIALLGMGIAGLLRLKRKK